jgi:hypothetical protein
VSLSNQINQSGGILTRLAAIENSGGANDIAELKTKVKNIYVTGYGSTAKTMNDIIRYCNALQTLIRSMTGFYHANSAYGGINASLFRLWAEASSYLATFEYLDNSGNKVSF